MGTNAFANNHEISSKASSGKTIAAFPDPCFTPPPTPAGVEPVVPYPNTAMASDLDKGSAKVLICNKMAALEKDSYIKTSTGDEAAKPSTMQGGVMTKTTKGKSYFIKWSDDVKFEGKGVCRNVDPSTCNHGSTPGNTAPMPHVVTMNAPVGCSEDIKKIEGSCSEAETQKKDKKDEKGKVTGTTVSVVFGKSPCEGLENMPDKMGPISASMKAKMAERFKYKTKKGNVSKQSASTAAMSQTVHDSKCLSALRCALQKYSDTNKEHAPDKDGKTKLACCPGQSGHHIVPSCMANSIPCMSDRDNTPTVCVEGVNNTHGTHGMIHRNLLRAIGESEIGKKIECKDARAFALDSMDCTFPDCNRGCIDAQLKENEGKDCSSCDKKTKVTALSGLESRKDASKPFSADNIRKRSLTTNQGDNPLAYETF